MPNSTTGYSMNKFGFTTPDSGVLPSVPSAAALALDGSSMAYKVTGTTTITSITGLALGIRTSLIFAAGVTVTNGANLKLAGAVNFVATADDVLTVVSDGTTIWETGRSIN